MSWIARALVPAAVGIAFALFRKFAPAPAPPSQSWTLEAAQTKERLAPGVIGLGISIIAAFCGLTFFAFRTANHLWAQTDDPAALHLYAVDSLWLFFPLFGAITIPWPLAVYLLRKLNRPDEADAMTEPSNKDTGFDSFRILKGMSFFVAIPIALLTFLAVPIHLSIDTTEARVGRYSHLTPEIFLFKDAKRAAVVQGYRLRDGSFRRHRDLLIEFSDGRILSANAAGDRGSEPTDSTIALLLNRTGLQPNFVMTREEAFQR